MNLLIPFFVSLLAGILAAWGVGGGTLLLLVMTLLLGIPSATAQSINLLFFLPCAAVALMYHRKNGYLKPELLRSLIPLGILSAVAATLLSGLMDTEFLRRPFAILLLIAAFGLLRDTKRSA